MLNRIFNQNLKRILTSPVIFFILSLILILILIPNVSALTITNETTETSIFWSWNDSTAYHIWVDNELILENYTEGNTLITNLEANTKHILELRDVNNTLYGRDIVTTNETNDFNIMDYFFNYDSWIFWFFMGIFIFIIGAFSFKILWILTIGCMITSFILYIPEISGNVYTVGMMLIYSGFILVSALGYYQER